MVQAAARFLIVHSVDLGCLTKAQAPASPANSQALAQASTTGTPLTLAQAEAMALKNNPQTTVGRLRVLVGQQYVREFRSALLPNANLSLTAVDANPGSRLTAGFLNNPILFPRAAGGASVSQPVTDFGRTTNLLSSSEFSAKAEDQNAAATRADILLAVDQAFYNSLDTQALVHVAEETVQAQQTLVDRVQALTDAKLKSELDLSFAKVELARAKAADLETEVNRQKLLDLQNTISRDVRISWQDTNRAYERLSVTKQLREQADLALDLAPATTSVFARLSNSLRPNSRKPRPTSPIPTPPTNIA
ncbi:MAG: hypothetical protein DMG39_15510 [Acidobacteria bacterium]|nr:MAG: hypothetical protein DMG39_15510 [Acidobacteriota bacterium]